jgi:hypothetical protein
VVEVDIEEGTSLKRLQEVLDEFLKNHGPFWLLSEKLIRQGSAPLKTAGARLLPYRRAIEW